MSGRDIPVQLRQSLIYEELNARLKYEDYWVPFDIFHAIIKHLESDGYIKIDEFPGFPNTGQTVTHYSLTFKGRYFISQEQGGYKGQAEKENAEKLRLENIQNTQINQQYWIIGLTSVLAIGTVWPLVKDDIPTFTVVAVCGLAFGTILSIPIVKMLNKNKSH